MKIVTFFENFVLSLLENRPVTFKQMSSNDASIIYNDPTISDPAVNRAKVHPLVIFKVADMFLRRGKDHEYCVGLLVGEILNREAIVRDVVPLRPGAQDEQEIISISWQQHHQLYPNEQLLGWYSFSETNIEFPSIIAEGANGIHLWMRPYVPPKIDVFSVKKSRDLHLVSLPIQYSIDANVAEQLSLSRIADAQSHGSLQAAINELYQIIEQTIQRIPDDVSGGKENMYNREICRKIHKAIAQAELNAGSIKSLEDSLQYIENFRKILNETNDDITKVEDLLSVQWK